MLLSQRNTVMDKIVGSLFGSVNSIKFFRALDSHQQCKINLVRTDGRMFVKRPKNVLYNPRKTTEMWSGVEPIFRIMEKSLWPNI